jgi:large subunit ribosomal protein L11
MDFCKEFNARTSHVQPGIPIPTLITVHPDRSFAFITKTPPTSYFLKKTTGIEKGVGKPGHETSGSISLKHIYEIAKIKQADDHLKHLPLESIARMVLGSCKSLGLKAVP